MDWIGASTTGTQTLATNDTVAQYIVLPSEIRDQFTDPTLVRTRGQFVCSGITGGFSAAVGIIDWLDNNDTPPAAAEAPSPLIATFDWIWHSYIFTTTAGGVLSGNWTDGGTGRSIDSKAMRRLGGRKGILIVVSNLSGSAGSLQFQWGIRCLLKD